MTTAEAARSVVMPSGSYRTARAVCVVDDTLHHRIAWQLDGLRKSAPTGPAFTKPASAIALAKFLNGDRSASRPGHPDSAGLLGADSGDEGAPPEAPIVAEFRPEAGTSSGCAGCGGPLPPGSRRDRRTCKPSCRIAAYRDGAKAGRGDADSEASSVTPTRASDVAGILADHVTDVIAACNPPDPAPEVGPEDRNTRGRSAPGLPRRSDPVLVPVSRDLPLSPGPAGG